MTFPARAAPSYDFSAAGEIVRLRQENEALRDRVEELERVFGLTPDMPPASFQPRQFGYCKSRGRIWYLICFIATRGRFTRDQAMTALYDYGADDVPNGKIIDVFLVTVRRYLAAHQITLRTHWGRGWSLSERDQHKAQMLIDALRREG